MKKILIFLIFAACSKDTPAPVQQPQSTVATFQPVWMPEKGGFTAAIYVSAIVSISNNVEISVTQDGILYYSLPVYSYLFAGDYLFASYQVHQVNLTYIGPSAPDSLTFKINVQ